MPSLKDTVISETMELVRVVYLDRKTKKWWNARRKHSEPAVLCGWFWVAGTDEAGPFKTRSAAVRDAYFRVVRNREVPAVAHDMINRPVPKKRRGSHGQLAIAL